MLTLGCSEAAPPLSPSASPQDPSSPPSGEAGATLGGAGAGVSEGRCAGLRLNELNPQGDPTDWVEIYNPTREPRDLRGCYLSDDLSDPFKGAIPEGAWGELAPGALVRLDVSDELLGFKLGSADSALLVSEVGEVIDSVTYAEEDWAGGVTLCRLPDGEGEWKTCPQESPGALNLSAPPDEPPPPPVLRINEVAAKGEPEDWVELILIAPPGVGPVALDGYALSDQPDISSAALLSGSVAAGERVVIEVSDATLGFKLAQDEAVFLWGPSGELIDSVDWEAGESPEGGSLARVPDGEGPFQTVAAHTRGGVNQE